MRKFILTKSQIMHVLTAVVIVPLSGWAATIVARYFPGIPNFGPGAIEGVFITGASAALGLGIHYLHGWQLWERTIGREVDVEDKTPKPIEGKPGELVALPPPAPIVNVHVHGANPGNITADSDGQAADVTHHDEGDAAASGAEQPTKVTPPQATTAPATEESKAISGV